MSTISQPQGAATRPANPYKQPAFIAAIVVLALAAVGLNGAVSKMQLHFKKQAVPLARDLSKIPVHMGPWLQISRDEPLDHDIQEVLGTDQYIFRDYLNIADHNGDGMLELIKALHADDPDTSVVNALASDYVTRSPIARVGMLINQLKDKTATQRKEALARVQHIYPDAVINMAVTYYTGLVDTVAHIPDRCYIADGFEPTEYEIPTWTLANGRQLQVRFINFQDSNGAARIDRSVAYFFNVNGGYTSDPLGVRRSLQNLFEKYGYYAKVELMTLDPDHQRSANTMTAFLSSALAPVETCFPDWSMYESSAAK